MLDSNTLAKSCFVGVSVELDVLYISVFNRKDYQLYELSFSESDLQEKLLDWFSEHACTLEQKIVAAGIGEVADSELLGEKLWLDLDIVPLFFVGRSAKAQDRAKLIAEDVAAQFTSKEGLDVVRVIPGPDGKIEPGFLTTLGTYEDLSHDRDFALLHKETHLFKANEGSLLFINSTPQGGGVALMRHALIRLYSLLGVDVSWHTLAPLEEVFKITKHKFHNILQGVAAPGVCLDEHDKEVYNGWIEQNAELLKEPLSKANVIVIDDWQPSGLIRYIKEFNPLAKIIFRSHIHVDTTLFVEGLPQLATWDFLWNHNRIKDTDIFISHPIEGFVPDVVPKEKVILKPATTEPLDGLNKHLPKEQKNYYLANFNRILVKDGQKALDLNRPYLTQVARFDPSKGIEQVIESFRLLREKLSSSGKADNELPQLVIAGHGAVDDPEGLTILSETKEFLKKAEYLSLKDDVKLARLPHNDQILGAVLQEAKVALQLSCKEGCEVKVTEALNKGKPIVIFKVGGMPLQVMDGENAFVVPAGDCKAVAGHLFDLLTDEKLYNKVSGMALEKVKHRFFTTRGAVDWLFMANRLLEKGSLKGQCKNIEDLVNSHYGEEWLDY